MRTARNLVAMIVILGFIGLLVFGLTRDPYVLPSPLVQNAAPDFALLVMDTLDHRPPGDIPVDSVRLSDLRGQVVILNFWASWCVACRQEHPELARAAGRFRDRPVRFFGVLYQDSPANARRFLREMGGQSYPTLLDPGSQMAIDYGVYGVPETFVIAPDGTVFDKHIGPVTESYLSAKIQGARYLDKETTSQRETSQ